MRRLPAWRRRLRTFGVLWFLILTPHTGLAGLNSCALHPQQHAQHAHAITASRMHSVSRAVHGIHKPRYGRVSMVPKDGALPRISVAALTLDYLARNINRPAFILPTFTAPLNRLD